MKTSFCYNINNKILKFENELTLLAYFRLVSIYYWFHKNHPLCDLSELSSELETLKNTSLNTRTVYEIFTTQFHLHNNRVISTKSKGVSYFKTEDLAYSGTAKDFEKIYKEKFQINPSPEDLLICNALLMKYTQNKHLLDELLKNPEAIEEDCPDEMLLKIINAKQVVAQFLNNELVDNKKIKVAYTVYDSIQKHLFFKPSESSAYRAKEYNLERECVEIEEDGRFLSNTSLQFFIPSAAIIAITISLFVINSILNKQSGRII